mmetsp:Transcript_21806/g.64300  ORF Transcript_21806/g.64300 Transcript_21806/m.64300 type:complete len:720 (+) Transcript_21806:4029-6188(+)
MCCGGSGDFIEWHVPRDVYFRGGSGGGSNGDGDGDKEASLTSSLFHVIEFHPFLSAVGVKSEPSTQDLFQLLLSSPRDVLRRLGSEERYIALLRRIAADPPFGRATKEIAEAPFLLAYRVEGEAGGDGADAGTAKYVLARAADVYVIDNSFFGRMFPVLRAPHESDLEDFYASLGSTYISSGVKKTFRISGAQRRRGGGDTDLVSEFAARLRERRPLLVSPSVTSRPLVKDAASALSDDRLVIAEADGLKAVYTLGPSSKEQAVTCCADSTGRAKNNTLYLTEEFDWFDVGNAVGGLILQRCQLEDAFLIGSLLEAPLEQLRARGFPVDRVLNIKPVSPVKLPVSTNTESEVPAQANSGAESGDGGSKDEGFGTILQQMFPDCNEDYIRAQIGNNPGLDRVKEVADSMASGNYPKQKDDTNDGATQAEKEKKNNPPQSVASKPPESQSKGGSANDHKRKLRLGKKLGRVLHGGKKGTSSPAAKPPTLGQHVATHMPPSHASHDNGFGVRSLESDVSANQHVEDMLQQSVDSARAVNSRGVSAPETVMTSIPEDLDRGSNGCEVIPAQNLQPFVGPYGTGKAQNGIRVFSSRIAADSEIFLAEHFHAVDVFARVLQNLCEEVYSLRLSSVAIYHDPMGNTIAFNSNKSLHFNLRYFTSLHFRPHVPPESSCYSYWFTTMAHELAHNLVSAHNKDHGYYTESYVTLFLPKLAALFQRLEMT